MLEEAGAIVDESARPAFSFEEAPGGIGGPCPCARRRRPARDKLAAGEHDFLTGDLSHHALQALGMRLSTPDFIGIQARRARLRQGWARFFEHIDVVVCPSAPNGPIRMRDQLWSMANKGRISI
jgi:amidase